MEKTEFTPEETELLKVLPELSHLYGCAIKEVRTKLEILDEDFRVKFNHNPIHHIEQRLKTPRSILSKLKKKELSVTVENVKKNITDIAGIRVVCNYIDDIEKIANLLLRQDDVETIIKKDYIACPKENGYRSLHLIILIPVFFSEKTEKVPVEIQLRTIAMDFWASLEHEIRYKSNDNVPENLKERLKKCSENIAYLDREMQSIKSEAAICNGGANSVKSNSARTNS